jgi:hypothetical protein
MEPSEVAVPPEGGTEGRTGLVPAAHGAAGLDPATDGAPLIGLGPPASAPPGGAVAADSLARDGDVGVLEQIEAELADVERALERLDDGTYSVCELCGRPIGDARLETLPATRVCADHGTPATGDKTL